MNRAIGTWRSLLYQEYRAPSPYKTRLLRSGIDRPPGISRVVNDEVQGDSAQVLRLRPDHIAHPDRPIR